MSVYADTSALLKLLTPEAESAALRAWLFGRGRVLTAGIGELETFRAGARAGVAADRIEAFLRGLSIVPMSERVLLAARSIGPAELRSLDALHLAAAAAVRREVETFVVYDGRLAEAASGLGFDVASPA